MPTPVGTKFTKQHCRAISKNVSATLRARKVEQQLLAERMKGMTTSQLCELVRSQGQKSK